MYYVVLYHWALGKIYLFFIQQTEREDQEVTGLWDRGFVNTPDGETKSEWVAVFCGGVVGPLGSLSFCFLGRESNPTLQCISESIVRGMKMPHHESRPMARHAPDHVSFNAYSKFWIMEERQHSIPGRVPMRHIGLDRGVANYGPWRKGSTYSSFSLSSFLFSVHDQLPTTIVTRNSFAVWWWCGLFDRGSAHQYFYLLLLVCEWSSKSPLAPSPNLSPLI